jgi:hypothetical protein
MCNYSNHYAKVRDSVVGDKLVTSGRGLVDASARDTAVCLKPGTEIAFDKVPDLGSRYHYSYHDFTPLEGFSERAATSRTSHHAGEDEMDYFEFADGTKVLMFNLPAGQSATVLQHPAESKKQKEEQRNTELV